MPLERGHAAVDLEGRAGGERAVVAGEVDHDPRDVVRGAGASDGDARDDRRAGFRVLADGGDDIFNMSCCYFIGA